MRANWNTPPWQGAGGFAEKCRSGITHATTWFSAAADPPSSRTPTPLFTRKFLLVFLFCITTAMSLRALQHYPTGVFDFYPLYYGGKAWLHNHNAYALGEVAPAADVTY